MSVFFSELVPEKIRLLVVKDLDILSINRLAEHFVHETPQFTACLACGPFVPKTDDSPEGPALALGVMATILSQLENIVCRVVYLPAKSDPTESLFKEMHLTPNSVNIHARWLPLVPGLMIGGYTEKSQLERRDVHDSEEGDEDSKAFIQSSNSSKIIQELLMNVPVPSDSDTTPGLSDAKQASSDLFPTQSILMLDTAYAHTLNHVLFHSQAEMDYAKVSTCICPSMENRKNSVADARKIIKGLHLIGPLSLKDGNNYLVLEYTKEADEANSGHIIWKLSSTEFYSL